MMILPHCPWQKRPTLAMVMTTLIVWLTAAGCGSSPMAPASMPDSVSSITDMVPVLGTKLLHGQTVTFTGTAGYSLLSADSGKIIMVIEDQADQVLQPAGTQPSATVGKGSGQVTLSQSITLPDEGVTVVRVFFPLAPAGATSTNAVVHVTYQVQ